MRRATWPNLKKSDSKVILLVINALIDPNNLCFFQFFSLRGRKLELSHEILDHAP